VHFAAKNSSIRSLFVLASGTLVLHNPSTLQRYARNGPLCGNPANPGFFTAFRQGANSSSKPTKK
jgi:hypothetical protein